MTSCERYFFTAALIFFSIGMSCDIGVYGLSVMGSNLALNIASKGFNVAVSNRSVERVTICEHRAKEENLQDKVFGVHTVRNCLGFSHIAQGVLRVADPSRKIILLVKAGAPVDNTIESLLPYLDAGDIIVDGGNEWFEESIRRTKYLEEKGFNFVSMGVSGGEIGARHGPSLMPSGRKESYDALESILTKIAAQVDNEACVTYIGGAGSGNYVKMVHNGIEYGDMELIIEVYHMLKNAGFSNDEMSGIFREWNKGELESYLVEITSLILAKHDEDVSGLPAQEGFLVDKILDVAGSKGTGMMTVKEAAERGVSAPTIASALFERYISGEKDMRMRAAAMMPGPAFDWSSVDKEQLVSDLRDALFCSKLVAYAQGLQLIHQASVEFNWGINLGECARIWKGGCIIRAKILDKIKQAFSKEGGLTHLLLDPEFAQELVKRQTAWRRVVGLAVATGVSIPALTSSLEYFDSFRSQRLPMNLLQAQRDFFGSHTFERVDQPRGKAFHCRWTSEHA